MMNEWIEKKSLETVYNTDSISASTIYVLRNYIIDQYECSVLWHNYWINYSRNIKDVLKSIFKWHIHDLLECNGG